MVYTSFFKETIRLGVIVCFFTYQLVASSVVSDLSEISLDETVYICYNDYVSVFVQLK